MVNTEDHFSLKWNNFRSSLTEGFHDFFQEEMMVDVTLAAEGKFLQAHKLILSVCSSYFKSLFNVNPCKHPIVILKDVSHHELANVLQFMYKGEVSVKPEELPSFLKLADTLKLKGLDSIKIENDSDSSSSQECSNVGDVKKKADNLCSDFDRKNLDSDSGLSRLKELRYTRQRKRRFSNTMKSDGKQCSQSKKMRVRKSDIQFQFQESGNEKNEDSVKLLNSSRRSRRQESNDGQAQGGDMCDNEVLEGKTSPNGLSSGVSESNAEAAQAPEEFINCRALIPKRCGKKSYIWKYFIKYQSSATCKLCGRNFRGFRPHTSIQFHLKNSHPREYQEFVFIREEQRQIMKKNNYFMFSKFFEEIHEKVRKG